MGFEKPAFNVLERAKAFGEYRAYSDPLVRTVYWGKLREVFNYLERQRWGTILEIGCGYGFLLPSLCKIAQRVIGSDINGTFDFCKRATLEEIQRNHSNLTLQKIDARCLSSVIGRESCDVIVAVSVLEHIREYQIVINEVSQCLKAHGIFLCVLPTENLIYRIGRTILRYPHEYHEGYQHRKLLEYLAWKLNRLETWLFPFQLPLFRYGVYNRRAK